MAGQEPAISKPYYPIGNSPPADITLRCRVARQCDILLLGCGDIRNVLYTTHALQQNGTSSEHVINFHLNDNECGIIARDLILLNIVKTVNPKDEADMKFLWSVWYDVLMSREHFDRLNGVINNLTKHISGDQNIYFGNDTTEHSVKNSLASWTKDEHGTEEVVETRCQFLKSKYTEKCDELSTQRVASRIIDQCHLFREEKLKDRYTQEVHEYTDVGTTRINTTNVSQKQILSTFFVNVTFFRPASTEWAVPDDSSPFMCYGFEREVERYDGAKITMAKIFLENLKEWVKSFQTAEKRCRLEIHLWLDDAKTLCEKTLTEDQKFDFIDTSNLADEIGVMALLVTLQGRLKEDTGVLRTETFDWHRCFGRGEHFLRLCVDIPPLMYPTVLGVHLAEELNIGHECRAENGAFEGVNRLVFRWKKAASFTPCTLTGSDGISSCLEIIQSPKPLQSTDTFQDVKPATFDYDTKRKLLDRLNKITINMTAVPKSASGDNPGNKVIMEHNDRYEVKIEIPADTNIGDLSLLQEGAEKRSVTFQLSTDKAKHFSTTLRFSCPVSLQNSTVSKKKNLIQGTFIKDQALCVGERVLPWKTLTAKDVSVLPDYPTSTFSLQILSVSLGFVYPNTERLRAFQKDNPYTHHQLQDIFAFLLLVAPVNLQVKMLYVPRRNPIGDTPLETCQATLVLEGHKLWEGQATTFVTVYNHDAAISLIREEKMSMVDDLTDMQDIPNAQVLSEKLLQGFDILSKILDINSHRLRQDSIDSRWKMKSFIQTRYPFKTSDRHMKESDLEARYLEAGILNDPFIQMQFLQELQERGGPDTFSSPAGRKAFETAMSTFKPVCACCGKMTYCKRCTACDNVYYCSRKCQRKAWPQHKQQCRK